MALNIFEISSNQILNKDRFEPNFHYIYNQFEKFEKKQKKTILNLGDQRILLKITDGEHSGQKFVNDGVRFIKNSAVRDFSINLLDKFKISESKHKFLKRSALKKDDILFTTIGHLGSAAIVKKNFGEANINQNLVKMEINKDFINPFYLTCYLNSFLTKRQIRGLLTRNIHSIITYPKIKSIKIVIAEKDFQEKIGNLYKTYLDLEDQMFLKIKKAQDIFYEEFNIEIKKTSKIFETNISKFKNHLWTPRYSYPKYNHLIDQIKKINSVKLGIVANFEKGDEPASENYNEYLDKNEDDIPFVRTSDMINYDLDLYPDFYVPKEIYNELSQKLIKGDILFSNDGKIGNISIIPDNKNHVVLQSHIRTIRLNHLSKKYKLSSEYLFLVLTTDVSKLQCEKFTVIQSTLATISNNLSNFYIPLISENKMKKITNLVQEFCLLMLKKREILKMIRDKFSENFK